MSTRTLSIGPHTLVCHERGEGEPVVLLHSGGFSSRQWRKLSDALVATHRVIAPDMLGYGASSRWPEGAPFHFRDEVDALAVLLEGEPAAHFVGHSYGGLVALHVALAHPARVRSLALFEPVAFGALDADSDAELRASLDLVSVPYDGEPWLCAFVDWWNGKGAWLALAPEARATFMDVGWKLHQEVLSLVQDRTDGATYGRITVPTLLLGGERTPAAEKQVLARLGAALPNGTVRLFPDVGHMGPITHSAAINAAIVEHIVSLGAA